MIGSVPFFYTPTMGPRPSAGPSVCLRRIVSEAHLKEVKRELSVRQVNEVHYDLKFRKKPNAANSLNGPLLFATVEMEEREVWRSSSINTKDQLGPIPFSESGYHCELSCQTCLFCEVISFCFTTMVLHSCLILRASISMLIDFQCFGSQAWVQKGLDVLTFIANHDVYSHLVFTTLWFHGVQSCFHISMYHSHARSHHDFSQLGHMMVHKNHNQ